MALLNRKFRTLFIILAVLFSFIAGAPRIFAGTVTGDTNDDVKITATRNENQLTVDFIANRALTFGGLGFDYSFDNKVSYESYSPNTEIFDGAKQINTDPAVQRVGLSSNVKTASAGTSLVAFSYNTTGDFQPDTDYVFSMTMVEVFDDNFNLFSWGKETFNVIYREHTVSFDLNGGDSGTIPDQLVVDGEKAAKPADPTREGYTFKGWKKADEVFDFDTAIKEKTELVAEWEALYNVSYSVSGDVPEGYTAPEGSTGVASGSSVTVETVPASQTGTKDGVNGTYTFAGWTAPEGLTIENGTFTMPDNDITLTGVWTFTPNSHKVTYTVSGEAPATCSEVPAEASYDVGTQVTIEEALTTTETKKGDIPGTWSFNGWDRTEAFSMPDEDVVITGTWTFTPDKYDVSYIVSGDKPADYVEPNGPKNVEVGTSLEMPENLTTKDQSKGGVPGIWTFSGWTITAPEGLTASEGKYTMPAASVTISGSWSFTPDTYTVTWMNGDTELEKDEKVAYNAAPEYNGETPVKTGEPGKTYTFTSWDPEISPVTKDVTYTAQFSETTNTYTVIWKNEDGTVLETDEGVPYDSEPSYEGETPVKAADDTNTYTFAGWTPEISKVTGDQTYTATFTATLIPTYTITYTDGADGAAFALQSTGGLHAGSATPAFNGTPSREGYTFKGWNPEVAETVSGDAVYTAQWEEIQKYTITFVDEDGTTVLGRVTVNAGDTPSYPGTTPVKAEDDSNTYTFAGWTPAIVPAAGDATYKATYTANPKTDYNLTDPVLPQPTEPAVPSTVTITWLNYDGTLIEKTKVAYNSTPAHDAPALTPASEGKTYTFKGWSPEIAAATADAAYTAQFTETDDESGETTDTTVPAPVTPEDTDDNPTNHEDLPDITTKSHTYEIYQIFTGDYTEMPADPLDESKGKEDILTNIVWGVNGKDPDNAAVKVGDPVDQAKLQALYDVTGKELDREKLEQIEKFLTIDGKPFRTITLGPNDTENSIPLPSGYYLIRDVADSQTGKHDAYTTYITVVIKDYTIQPKSVIPTVDKQVYDNADDGANEKGWAETADHAINESFQFALIGTIPQNDHLRDYTNGYIVKFTDTMSEGVTFEGIESVKVNDRTVEAGAAAEGGYAVTGVNTGEAGKTWSIELDARKILGEEFGTEAVTVTVTYNAHLNENAVIHSASDNGEEPDNTNRNTVYLEYSNNPNTGYGTDMGKTEEDNVWVFTYEVDNIKKADSVDGSPLAGAGFTLYKDDAPVKLIKIGTDADYIPAASDAENAITEMITDKTGVFNVKGLDTGTYTLRETKVPAGYNSLGDTTITINASHEETPAGTAAKLNLTGSNMNNTIINQSGAELPSTGGIGTTIFYIIGTGLILGSGVILVSRRRVIA